MSENRKHNKCVFVVLFLGILLTALFFWSQMTRIDAYQRQYLEKDEWKQIDAEDLGLYATGLKEVNPGVYEVTKAPAVIQLYDKGLNGFERVTISIIELDDSGIDLEITSGKQTDSFRMTKGTNVFFLSEPVSGGNLRITLENAAGVIFHLENLVVQRVVPEKRFSATLLVLVISVVLIVCFAAAFKKKIGRTGLLIVIFVEFLLIFIQYRNVYLYFDDYGYLSLTYRGLYAPDGMNYGLTDILMFLRNHYLEWGGRVLGFFIEIVLGRNLMLLRIIQSLLVTGIFILSGRLAGTDKDYKNALIAYIVPCMIYMLAEINIMREAAYWYTASVLYLSPVVLVFGGTYLFDHYCRSKDSDNKNTRKLIRVCPIILFIAAFSQEQISAAVVCIVLLITAGVFIRNRKLDLWHVICILASAAGFFLLLFCPGSGARMGETEKNSFIVNLKTVITVLASDSTKWISLVLIVADIMICLCILWRSKRRVIQISMILLCTINVLTASYMLFRNCGIYTALESYFRILRLERLNFLLLPFVFVYLLALFAHYLVWFLYYDPFRYLAWIVVGAASTLAVAIVSPSIASRMLLPFYMLLIPAITRIILYFTDRLSGFRILYGTVALSVVLTTAVLNYYYILNGYYQNSFSEEYNDEILQDYYANSDHNQVVLKKHRDDTFGNMMPYMGGYEWIAEYMKAYYELPGDAVIEWKGDQDIAVRKSN